KGKDVYHRPPRSTSRAAKADVWAHLIHDRDIAHENYPVYGKCFGQNFKFGGRTDAWTCEDGCDAGLVDDFPRCVRCDDIVFEPDEDGGCDFCGYCSHMMGKDD